MLAFIINHDCYCYYTTSLAFFGCKKSSPAEIIGGPLLSFHLHISLFIRRIAHTPSMINHKSSCLMYWQKYCAWLHDKKRTNKKLKYEAIDYQRKKGPCSKPNSRFLSISVSTNHSPPI